LAARGNRTEPAANEERAYPVGAVEDGMGVGGKLVVDVGVGGGQNSHDASGTR